jgi:hypothetical protein
MIATITAEHLVHETDGLGLELEHRRTHHDHVAHQRFTPVVDALVHGRHPAPRLAQVRRGHAE